MLFHCLRCRSNTESKNPKVLMAKNGRMMLLRKWVVCEIKKIEIY